MADGRSALLIPVPAVEPVVGEWRSLYDPSAACGVPAHITLLVPFVRPTEIDVALLEELRAHFAAVKPFAYRFPTFARFPGVVYLAPEPARPFRTMIADLHARFPDHPPYGGIHDDVVPHLTVADRRDRLDIVLMQRIERALGPRLPLAARATEVWLMAERRKRWRRKARFPLGG